MPTINNQRNPIIRTTTVTTYAAYIGLATNPIVNIVGDRFVLEIDQEVPYGTVLPMVLDDTTSTYVVYDRYGNLVRADRLVQAVQFRKMGLLPFNGCSPYQFQCVLGSDPGRVNVLCCLPRSNYSSSTDTTALTVSDTGAATTSTASTTEPTT